jgi:hypothetical protein
MVFVFVMSFVASRLMSITRKIQADIDKEISSRAIDSDMNITEVERRVSSSRPARRGGPWLLRQRVRYYLVETSALRRDALAEIKERLPALPRSAKRIYNHLHLVLSIAVGRAALGGSPKLEPRHLGKWVVLIDRWPELHPILSSTPEVMSKLETSADVEELEQIIGSIRPNLTVSDSEELHELVVSDPKLSIVLDRLIYLSPVGKGAPLDGVTVPGRQLVDQ